MEKIAKRTAGASGLHGGSYRIAFYWTAVLLAYRGLMGAIEGGVVLLDVSFFALSILIFLAASIGLDNTRGLIDGLMIASSSLVIVDMVLNVDSLRASLLILYAAIIALSMMSLKLSSETVQAYSSKGEAELKDDLKRGDSAYAVELIDVYKDYVVGDVVVKALRGMSFKVKKGEFVAIMGPSGSGKTTTLNMIGALDRPTSGKVLIDGVDISKLSDDELSELRNKKIGFIFQAFNLINRTTVLGNVVLPSIVSGLSRRERIEKAKRLLKLVGLEAEMDRSPRFLSGGQQQRVAIARALMNDPEIILADEPTGNLDTKTGDEVMEYIKKLNRELGTTVIVVTHDPEVARKADRIIYIRDGRVWKEEIVNGERYEN